MHVRPWISLMHRRAGVGELMCALVVLWAIAGTAQAAAGSFGASAQVVSRTAASQALAGFPVPPGARHMARIELGDAYLFTGDASTAARFYLDTMPKQGYRLLEASMDQRMQHWGNGRDGLAVSLHESVGTEPLTRIVVKAGPVA